MGGGGGGGESESGSGGQRKWAVYHSATESETQPFELVLTVTDNFPVGFTQACCCEGAAPNNSNKKTVNKQHDWNKVDMEEEEECRAALVLSSRRPRWKFWLKTRRHRCCFQASGH